MGEMSDMIVNGDMCEWCGTIFEVSHGYPVLCDDCWNETIPKERKGHQREIKSKRRLMGIL